MQNRTEQYIGHISKVMIAAIVMAFFASGATAQQPSGNSSPSNDGLLELPTLPVTSAAPASHPPAPLPPLPAARQVPPPASSGTVSGLQSLPNITPKAPAPLASPAPHAPGVQILPGLTPPPAAVGSIVQIPSATDALGTGQVPDPRANLTLMFTEDDISKVEQALKIYDSYDEHKPVPVEATAPKPDIQDDIFASYATASPPNLYLASIVYYSPKNWSIRLNDKRVNSSDNAVNNRFYISKISRKEVEIVWTPVSMSDVLNKWEQLTEGGKKSIPNVRIDNATNKIVLDMRPNQTFVINTLDIREGLIK